MAELARLRSFQRLFDRFDSDGNGILDKDETAHLHAELVQRKYAIAPIADFWLQADVVSVDILVVL